MESKKIRSSVQDLLNVNVFQLRSSPGRFYVQSDSEEKTWDKIVTVLHTANHVRVRRLPFDEHSEILKLSEQQQNETDTFSPKNWSWVRFTAGTYVNDIGLVHEQSGASSWIVFVVPRIHSRFSIATSQRPPKRFLSTKQLKDAFPDDAILDKGNGEYSFRGDHFVEGFLLVNVTDPTTITSASPDIDEAIFFTYMSNAEKFFNDPFLRINDRVLIQTGEYQGLTGNIESFNDFACQVRTDCSQQGIRRVNIPRTQITRIFEIGDAVELKLGLFKGTYGIVCSQTDGVLCIYARSDEILVSKIRYNFSRYRLTKFIA